MTTFDRREKAFEQKFVHDEELRFKAIARRNRLLGAWVAEQLGLSSDAATAYAKSLVAAGLERSGDGDILNKVAKDLAQKGISERQVRQKMEEFLHVAIEQIEAGH